MNRRDTYILVTVMLLALAVQTIASIKQKSPVCDEVSHHIATGYSFLKTRDFRLNSTSPPLTEELAAAPLLFLKPALPLDHPSWSSVDRVVFGFQFLYRYNKDADQLVFWARIPMLVLSLFCALLVFIFAGDLYGRKAGLFAMFLYVFSPNIIAYSGLDIPDIGATFFILLAIYRFYKFIKKPKLKNILLAGITVGLAEASKFSALILLPLFLLAAIWRAISAKKPKYIISTLGILAICYLVVFAAYFGEVKPLLKNDIDVQEKITYIEKTIDKVSLKDKAHIKEKAVDFALNTPVPFATYIMNILAEANMVFAKDYGAFLMGRRSARGWWYYYPLVFLFKTPISMLALFILSILFFIKVEPSNIWAERIGLLFLALFIIASLNAKLQLSVRYILPVYPLIFIYISKIINVRINRRYILGVIIIALCIWYAVDSLMIYPDYLAYFNQLAGGPDNGWRYLRDANIDYGQDLPALSRYLKSNGIEVVKLLYYGTAEPQYYGIRAQTIEENEKNTPKGFVYAVSVNYLDNVKWTESVKPTAKAGYSIFIYDLRGSR